jgi:hypothetical protein
MQMNDEPRSADGERTTEGGKSSYEELIVMEKPSVKWEEVVGLDTAKKAFKEAIGRMASGVKRRGAAWRGAKGSWTSGQAV